MITGELTRCGGFRFPLNRPALLVDLIENSFKGAVRVHFLIFPIQHQCGPSIFDTVMSVFLNIDIEQVGREEFERNLSLPVNIVQFHGINNLLRRDIDI